MQEKQLAHEGGCWSREPLRSVDAQRGDVHPTPPCPPPSAMASARKRTLLKVRRAGRRKCVWGGGGGGGRRSPGVRAHAREGAAHRPENAAGDIAAALACARARARSGVRPACGWATGEGE